MAELPHISREFKEKMSEWQTIKNTLKAARIDISALNSREKELKTFLSAYMNANKIDKCNCKDGSTVNSSKKLTKGILTEQVIKSGLLEYLKSQEQADDCWIIINNNRTPKETTSLTYKAAKK